MKSQKKNSSQKRPANSTKNNKIEIVSSSEITQDNTIVFLDICANSTTHKSLIEIIGNKYAKVSFFLTQNYDLYENEANAQSSKVSACKSLRELRIPNHNKGFFILGNLNIIFRITPPIISNTEHLTSRENEIMNLLSKGKLYKEIAEELRISIQTVKSHLKHIYSKMCVSNRSEAILRHLLK